MTVAAIEHIVIDDNGVPHIAGSRIRVSQIALEYEQYGNSADAVRDQHSQLSQSQIHAALAYYFDHVPEIRAELDAQAKAYDAALRAQENSPLVQKLRARLKDRE